MVISTAMRSDTTVVADGFYEISIRLVLKGRDEIQIYAKYSEGQYTRNSPTSCVIGEIELSALLIGIGSDYAGIIMSDLRITFNAIGSAAQYRAALFHAGVCIDHVNNISYSYRQMGSPLLAMN